MKHNKSNKARDCSGQAAECGVRYLEMSLEVSYEQEQSS